MKSIHLIALLGFLTAAEAALAERFGSASLLEWSDVEDVKPMSKAKPGDFIDRLVKLAPSQSRRLGKGKQSLYQLPSESSEPSMSMCGMNHIRSDRAKPFLRSVSACMMAGLAQEWRETVCPTNSPDCRLMMGDASYGNRKPGHWPHKTHHDGQCVDIWPVRKPGYRGELTIHSKGYDRERTRKLVALMVKWGAETTKTKKKAQFFFNDPSLYKDKSLGIRKLGNHDNHIHVCFRQNDSNYNRCKKHTVNVNLCPTLKLAGE